MLFTDDVDKVPKCQLSLLPGDTSCKASSH